MRKSLSESVQTTRGPIAASAAIGSAIALSAVLAVAAGIDSASGQGLVDHAETVYAPHGEHASAGLLYGLLYFVAAVNVALWLLVRRVARSGKRWAGLLAGLVVLINAMLALTLLMAAEYGSHIFPARWAALAVLPCVPGIAAFWRLLPGSAHQFRSTTQHFRREMTHDARGS